MWCPGAESNHRHEDFQSIGRHLRISQFARSPTNYHAHFQIAQNLA